MTLQTFNTLEQAVIRLQSLVNLGSYAVNKPKTENAIYPARYDHAPINNLGRQIQKAVPLTDRQQVLAITLVTKYHKQWKKQGYDVSNISIDTPTEFAIRTGIERSHTASVSGNMITLKFPYKPRLISQIAEFAQISCGRIEFNKETKLWQIAATAGNLTWCDKFVNDHKFTVDSLYDEAKSLIEDGYDYKSIQLDIVDGELVLNDAPESMLDWIRSEIGDVSMPNFIQLVSASHILAFTLSYNVVNYTFNNYPHLADILLMRRTFINSDEVTLTELLHKVRRLDYDNIVLFVTEASNYAEYAKVIATVMPSYNIITLDTALTAMPDPRKKTVYVTTRVIAGEVDLIISMAGFMAGPSRRNWLDSARKNIYYCQDIDDKIKKIIKKDESNFNYKRRNER